MARLTYEDIQAMLRVNRHNLDNELEIQGEMMSRIIEEVARHNHRQLEAKDILARTEARLLVHYKDSDEKMSEKHIAAQITRDPERVKAAQDYYDAVREHKKWEGLMDGWKSRGFALTNLCDLYVAQYFNKDSHQSRRDSRERDTLEARRALREASSKETSDSTTRPTRRAVTRRDDT